MSLLFAGGKALAKVQRKAMGRKQIAVKELEAVAKPPQTATQGSTELVASSA
jgi:hypothetical protein